MLKGSFFIAIIVASCGMAFCDSIEVGKTSYTDVLISGATKEKISFIKGDRYNVDRDLGDITRLTIDSFPEFNKAEELASQGEGAKAMKQYLEAYKAVDTIKEAWRKKSLEYISSKKKELADACDANAKDDWIKTLIKCRYARAKEMLSGEIDSADDNGNTGASSSSANDDAAKFCAECRGKGKIKCAKCNGSGKQKCNHMVDGEKHANYYEICAKCNGKGFEIEHYTEEVWVPDPHRTTYRGYGHYETRSKTRKVPCSGKGCKPYKLSSGKTIYVTWICPYCANTNPVGYVDCPYCEKGRQVCPKCGGTGKLTSGGGSTEPATAEKASTDTVASVQPENELASPNSLMNTIEKAVGEKLPKSPYKEYVDNELKRQKDRETFDQTIEPFIIATQKYCGSGVMWRVTVERVSKVQRGSFIITANFVRDNANADIWTIKAIVPSRFAEVGAKLSSNSPVEITGKISGIDYKYETITLSADEIRSCD